MPPLRIAAEELAQKCKTMRRLFQEHGPPQWSAKPKVDQRFATLARSICSQQLAAKAANTIWNRTVRQLNGKVTASSILRHDVASLRSAGLSRNKSLAMLDLAKCVREGRVNLKTAGRRRDEEIIEELVQVRGIGVWTAQMFLIFALRRLDQWATGDLGVRKGYMIAYGLDAMPATDKLELLGEKFRPYRSIACHYCWRAADAG